MMVTGSDSFHIGLRRGLERSVLEALHGGSFRRDQGVLFRTNVRAISLGVPVF